MALIRITQSFLGWLSQAGYRVSIPVVSFLILASILLVWRFVKFTVIPWRYPNDPQEYPSWLPWIGHLFSFFQNSDNLLQSARIYCGDTREPFAVTIAGSKMYVLTRASDVSEAYRNINTLSFNVFVQEMLRTVGNTEFCIEQMYHPLPKNKEGFPNPHGKPLATLGRDMHIKQLFPGTQLSDLTHRFNLWFDGLLHPDEIMKRCSYAHLDEKGAITLPLMTWCSEMLTRAGQHAYFGPLIEEIAPDMVETFLEFDSLSYQIQFQYPKWLSSKLHKAKDRMADVLVEYFDTPHEQRTGDAWFLKSMENEMRAIGISTRDIALMMTTIYWGINTNTRKAAFWMLAFLSQDAELYQALQEETAPAFGDSDVPDNQYLLRNCPRLNAAWDETVRMSAFSASVRHVTEDTVIGGKILRKGNRLMIPYRQLHFNSNVFGSSIDSFQSTRFLSDKTMASSGSWRPFGGGNTQCPGRFAAKEVVIAFVAMLVRRFHFEAVGAQQFPKGQLGRPVLGIMDSMSELDVRLRART